MNHKSTSHGFTLIELLIVVSILVLLSTMFSLGVFSQLFKSNDARRKSDLNQLKIAFENYYGDHNYYPNQTTLDSCLSTGNLLQPYLDKIPCDPVTKVGYQVWVDSATAPQQFIISVLLQGPNPLNYYVSSPDL